MRSHWDMFRELDAMKREIDQAFTRAGLSGSPFSRRSFLPSGGAIWPLVNMSEDENHVNIEALAPGLDPESIKIQGSGSMITISGERKPLASAQGDAAQNGNTCHRSERPTGRFTRTIELSTDIDLDKIEANYVNGILKIQAAKAEHARPKQITVQVG